MDEQNHDSGPSVARETAAAGVKAGGMVAAKAAGGAVGGTVTAGVAATGIGAPVAPVAGFVAGVATGAAVYAVTALSAGKIERGDKGDHRQIEELNKDEQRALQELVRAGLSKKDIQGLAAAMKGDGTSTRAVDTGSQERQR